jgi:hypothetical protein
MLVPTRISTALVSVVSLTPCIETAVSFQPAMVALVASDLMALRYSELLPSKNATQPWSESMVPTSPKLSTRAGGRTSRLLFMEVRPERPALKMFRSVTILKVEKSMRAGGVAGAEERVLAVAFVLVPFAAATGRHRAASAKAAAHLTARAKPGQGGVGRGFIV